jgi:hypothetical protein
MGRHSSWYPKSILLLCIVDMVGGICTAMVGSLIIVHFNPGPHPQCPFIFSIELQCSPSSLYFSHHPPDNGQAVDYWGTCQTSTVKVLITFSIYHWYLMQIIVLIVFCSYVGSAVLKYGHAGQWPGGANKYRGPMRIYVCCVQHAFKCINTDFVGSTNT